MKYEPKYNWEIMEEEILDTLHKLRVKELETGNENTTWINLNHWQTDDDRYKKHIDNWVMKQVNASKGSVL